jgi:hypothetical protein
MLRFPTSDSTPATVRRALALAVVAALGLVLSTAHAHDLPQERTALVRVSKDRVEVMIVYLEPPGATVDLLMKRFDLNGDGSLTGPEARLAGGEWMPRVLRGLQFEVAGETPRAREPEIKFRVEKKGSLSAAVYARWDLEPLDAGESRTVHVRVLRQPEVVPTEITFQSGSMTTITDVALPPRFGGAPTRPLLASGEQASVSVLAVQAPTSPERDE